MKKIFVLAVASLVFCASLDAQTYDVLDKVRADWRLRSGMEGPHRLGPSDLGQMSKAPRGYKPFYISHYGRHGSRTAWNSGTYDLIHKVFTQAHEENRLTAKGEEFYRKYEDFYLVPFVNSGDLVPLGYEQHKKIGEWTYDQFPAVFKGAKKVDAVVSTSQRSIVSMGSFCVSLKGRNPKLDIYMESSHTNMTIAAPTSAPKQFIRYFKGQFDSPVGESRSAFSSRIVDYDRILGTFFKDVSFLEGVAGNLTALDLSGNEITGDSLGWLSRAEKMQVLRLDHVDMGSLQLSFLAGMPDLTELSARDCSITDVSGMEACKALGRISLGFNEISDISPIGKAAADRTVLTLDLAGNQVENLSALKGKYQELILIGNPVSSLVNQDLTYIHILLVDYFEGIENSSLKNAVIGTASVTGCPRDKQQALSKAVSSVRYQTREEQLELLRTEAQYTDYEGWEDRFLAIEEPEGT